MKRRTILELGAVALVLPLSPRAARAADDKVCERVVARIGTNHLHVLEVSLADVVAGVDKAYDIAGTSGHSHSVALTADHFARVRAGELVRLPSSREGGHIHRILVRCGPKDDPPELVNACEIEIGGKDDHELIVPEADVQAKADKTYDIQGIAPHPHAITLKGADFEKLLRGQQVVVTSTVGDGHAHRVFVRYPKKK